MEVDPKKDHKKKKSKSTLPKAPVVDEANLPQVKALTEEQKNLLEQFRATVTKLVVDQDSEIAEWALETLCLLRYLRARNWNLEKSEKMITNSIKWKSEYKPHKITFDEVKDVLSLGSLYRNGKDKEGRPMMFIKPGGVNPHSIELRVRTMMYVIEQAVADMDKSKGVEKMVWFLDFTDYGSRARSPDGRKVAQTCLHLLQDHYPERLGLAFVVNPPWWASLVFTVMAPFMDSVTKNKIHFVHGDQQKLHQQLTQYVDEDQLEKAFGGTRDPPDLTTKDALEAHHLLSDSPKPDKKKKTNKEKHHETSHSHSRSRSHSQSFSAEDQPAPKKETEMKKSSKKKGKKENEAKEQVDAAADDSAGKSESDSDSE